MKPRKLSSLAEYTQFATELQKAGTVYLLPEYKAPAGAALQPHIKTLEECDGVIRTIDYDAISIAWNTKRGSMVTAWQHYPISVVNFLVPAAVWLASDELKMAQEEAAPIAKPTDLVYVKADAKTWPASEMFPIIGSPYETYGKIYEIVQNDNRTATALKVKFFNAERTRVIEQSDLITAQQYKELYHSNKSVLVLIEPVGPIPVGTEFIRGEHYFEEVDQNYFLAISEESEKVLIKKG